MFSSSHASMNSKTVLILCGLFLITAYMPVVHSGRMGGAVRTHGLQLHLLRYNTNRHMQTHIYSKLKFSLNRGSCDRLIFHVRFPFPICSLPCSEQLWQMSCQTAAKVFLSGLSSTYWCVRDDAWRGVPLSGINGHTMVISCILRSKCNVFASTNSDTGEFDQ